MSLLLCLFICFFSTSRSTTTSNTPYFYNITSLKMGDTISMNLVSLDVHDKFEIIFTNEQVDHYDINSYNKDLMMVINVRFYYMGPSYSIYTTSRHSGVWESPGVELVFSRSKFFPFQLNKITYISIKVKEMSVIENKFTIFDTETDQYESYSQTYYIKGGHNYQSLKALSITKRVSVQSISQTSHSTTTTTTPATTTTTTTPVNTIYSYSLNINVININDTIRIKLRPLITNTKFLGVYILKDNNMTCTNMHSVPLSIVMHFDQADLSIDYKRTNWVNVKTVSHSVLVDTNTTDILITLVDTFRVLINVDNTDPVTFLFDLRQNFSIRFFFKTRTFRFLSLRNWGNNL